MSFSSYVANIWGNLRNNANNDVWTLVGSGAPTNGTSGTGVGIAGPGSFYVRTSNGAIYANTNTKASPTWVQLESSSGGTIDGATITNSTLGVTNTVALLDTLFSLKDNVDPTKILAFQLSGITTATTRTLTVPDASTTLVGTDTIQTLTNKTLTAPVIATMVSGGQTVTVPAATDTLVGKATTDTLTNKTLTAPVITNPVVTAPVQALGAAGTNQSNGGAVTLAGSGIVYATGADATKGIVLPVGAVGQKITVVNDAAANAVLKVYGNTGDSATINAVAGSTAYSMAAKTSVDFIFCAAAKWQTLPLLAS